MMALIDDIKFGTPFKAIFLILMLVASLAFADETNLTLTVDGITYSNVVFGTVTPSSVSFRHSTGAATVPLAKLPPLLQTRFGYDANRATEYQRLEAEQLAKMQLAEQQRAKERENADKQAKQRAELERGATYWRIEVIQVLDKGLLVTAREVTARSADLTEIVVAPDTKWAYDSSGNQLAVGPKRPYHSGTMFLVGVDTSALTDGSSFPCLAYIDGRYQYQSPGEITRTVPRLVFISIPPPQPEPGPGKLKLW